MRFLEELHRRLENTVLGKSVVRPIERIPVLERHQQRSWRSHGLGYLAQQLDRYCRHTLSLELRRDQTDRLMAHRSHGDKERDVDLIVDDLGGRLRC